MNRSSTAFLAALAAAVLFTLLVVRCGDNEEATILDPSTGGTLGEGVITGILDWGEASPWPVTVVYAIPFYVPNCDGGASTIHITGENNNWDEGSWESTPGMTEIFPCFWRETLTLSADNQFEWKFVTGATWDGSFVAGGAGVDQDTRRGTTAGGNGDNLIVAIPADGEYTFLLNVSTDPGYFWVLDEEEALWDSAGGDSARFTIENLDAGTYTIVIQVPGDEETYPLRYVRAVRVSGEEGVDLDTVSVILTGAIGGVVALSDLPPTRPAIDIYVSLTETGAAVDTVSLTPDEGIFSITGLNEDEYDLWFHSASYVDTLLEGIRFVLGDDVDLGTVTLTRGGAVTGAIEFLDDPETKPEAGIFYDDPFTALRLASAVADPVDGSSTIDGIRPGAASIDLEARRYLDTTLVDLPIVAAETTDVGTIILQPGCTSVASTIHLLGDFNEWDEALFAGPGMDQFESCRWRDTIDIHGSFQIAELKFVTDGAYNTPPDYARCDSFDTDGVNYGPICLVSGGGNLAIIAQFPGRYQVILDEEALEYRLSLIEQFTASISGEIEYDTGLLPPYPAIDVEAARSGETTVLASSTVDVDDGTFTVSGLDEGTYDLTISGSNLRDTTFTSLTVAAGEAIDIGTIIVTEVTFQSEFTVIRIVGDFNNWDTSRPSMNQTAPGVWVDTIDVAARPPDNCHFMKFRTANDWTENDYHNCGAEDNTCSTPLAGPICTGTGNSDPPALGKIQIDPGMYEFRLDEVNLTYTITLIP